MSDYIDNVLIKLRRRYRKDEVVKALDNKLKECDFNKGVLQSENDELKHNLEQLQKENNTLLKRVSELESKNNYFKKQIKKYLKLVDNDLLKEERFKVLNNKLITLQKENKKIQLKRKKDVTNLIQTINKLQNYEKQRR